MASSITDADQTAMRAEAATVIRDVVAPAYQKLLTFIRDEYLTKARTTPAANAEPDGEAYYQAMIEKFTTVGLMEVVEAVGTEPASQVSKCL